VKKLLFLDDFRTPKLVPQYDYATSVQAPFYQEELWDVVCNHNEFVTYIEEYYEINNLLPELISFDHDLSDLDCEIWRDIKNYEGIYEVSNLGHVYHKSKVKGTIGEMLKPDKNESGLYVCLRNKGNDRKYQIHRIVMESFYGIDPNRTYVNHKDGNRWNNNINNLEWSTNAENLTSESVIKHETNKNYIDRFFIPEPFIEKTGYDSAKWLVDFCINNNLELPNYLCHSQNPVGKENILKYLDNYIKSKQKNK